MLVPRVDGDLCISCGLCVDLVPSVFSYDDQGVSEVTGPVTQDTLASVVMAMEGCPTQAIQEAQ